MTQTEDGLRQALRRVEPPAGFTERVVAGALEDPAPLSGRFHSWKAVDGSTARWTAAALKPPKHDRLTRLHAPTQNPNRPQQSIDCHVFGTRRPSIDVSTPQRHFEIGGAR